MRLHEKVKVQAEIIEDFTEQLLEMKRYLTSTKFSEDVMVNKNDILMRLNEIDNSLIINHLKID